MNPQFPIAGAASSSLANHVHVWWVEAAANAGVNLEGFDPDAPLGVRLSWATQASQSIALSYIRYSSKQQHSDEDQLRANVVYAAQQSMYIPPEYVCVDKAVTGRRIRRDGLNRVKWILNEGLVSVFLIFTLSRLFRRGYEAYKFVQEQVVEAGVRAVAVSQGIDTADERSWKLKFQVHGIMDEMLLESIADHCREGLLGLHLKGWVTGAIGVGYRRKELPDAPLTNRGLLRTMPQINPEVAELIRMHFKFHIDGVPLNEGLRRWLAAGGPCDPRSTTKRMTYTAYRRLLSNIRLTGRWEFGRNRNRFSTKLDYVQQMEQPESEVATYQCEELRIIDDETFTAMQSVLAGLKSGPRGPRKKKQVRLWDLTTEFFFCAQCSQPDQPVRFYQTGAHGTGMQCKRGDQCPCKSAVRREEAVLAVCETLSELIRRDSVLIEEVICKSCERDEKGDEGLRQECAKWENSIRTLTRRIDDLYELSGVGSEDDRKDVKARIRGAQSERVTAQLEMARLKKALGGSKASLTPESVRKQLDDMASLLEQAAAGQLGDDAVYKTLAVFRRLTAGVIYVHVERRQGRKRTNVRGVFRPHLIQAWKGDAKPLKGEDPGNESVSVWLRKPPRADALAEQVHQLIDIEGLSYRAAAKRLQEGGLKINSGNVWSSYRRYYEMKGATPPKLPYNNGRKRKPK